MMEMPNDKPDVTPPAGRNRMSLRRWSPGGLRLAVALLAWGAAAGPSFAQTAPPPADDLETIQARALTLVNQTRQEHDLPPLTLEGKLNVSAQAHADDMFTRRYYDHASPEGRTARDRYIDTGGSKWRLVGENIARCEGCRPPRRVGVLNRLQQGWMESPDHRANILRKGLTHFGFGMVVDEERILYAVQTFAGPGLPRGLRADEEPMPLSPEEQTRQALQLFNQARAQSGGAGLESSPALNQAAQAILPDENLENFDLESRQDLLSRSERRRWQSISVLSATCGGCGAVPTAADVRNFAQQWLEDPSYKQALLDARITHVGFAIATNGEGMKVALVLLGVGP
jgi:uncharacterized protein YkwD